LFSAISAKFGAINPQRRNSIGCGPGYGADPRPHRGLIFGAVDDAFTRMEDDAVAGLQSFCDFRGRVIQVTRHHCRKAGPVAIDAVDRPVPALPEQGTDGDLKDAVGAPTHDLGLDLEPVTQTLPLFTRRYEIDQHIDASLLDAQAPRPSAGRRAPRGGHGPEGEPVRPIGSRCTSSPSTTWTASLDTRSTTDLEVRRIADFRDGLAGLHEAFVFLQHAQQLSIDGRTQLEAARRALVALPGSGRDQRSLCGLDLEFALAQTCARGGEGGIKGRQACLGSVHARPRDDALGEKLAGARQFAGGQLLARLRGPGHWLVRDRARPGPLKP
jgi:hypothetical protein